MIRKAASPERRAAASRAGRLQIGIDVAGAGQDGDETAFAVRRGDRVLDLQRKRGMTPDAIRSHALELLELHREPDDWADDNRPIIVVDRDGSIGAKVYDIFVAYRSRDSRAEAEFRLVGFQGGAPPIGRMKDSYKMNRDLLFAGLVEWLKDGGSIPEDLKLEGELVALRWKLVEGGKSQLEPKSEIRERLGRSPDSADALALSVWGSPSKEAAANRGTATAHAEAPTSGDPNAWAYEDPTIHAGDPNAWAYER
jgi:hypothetical protein